MRDLSLPLGAGRLALGTRALLVREVLVAYLRARWALRGSADSTLPRAVASVRRAPAGRPDVLTTAQQIEVGRRLGVAVIRTLTLLPSDSRCLFRSLTLLTLLERRGIPSKLVLAVRPRPFAAHAWLEHEGHALLPAAAGAGWGRLMEL